MAYNREKQFLKLSKTNIILILVLGFILVSGFSYAFAPSSVLNRFLSTRFLFAQTFAFPLGLACALGATGILLVVSGLLFQKKK